MDVVAVLSFTVITSKILIRNIIKLLCNADISICRSVNYRGKAIPAIGGIVFVPILLIAVLLFLFLKYGNMYDYMSYLLLVLSMGFIGVIDDLIGDKRPKGLIRHFVSTIEGTMTTGFLKALSGFLVSCIISFETSKTLNEFFINAFILALFANTLNLFDLRPGRAIKVYLLYSVILLAGSIGRLVQVMPFVVLSIAAVLFISYDLKEVCMLGDTGANILGISLGYYSNLLLSLDKKLILLILLVFINILTERISITDIIKGNRLLNYFDSLGREQTGNND